MVTRVTKHHRFLLRLHLNQIDAIDAAMAALDAAGGTPDWATQAGSVLRLQVRIICMAQEVFEAGAALRKRLRRSWRGPQLASAFAQA
jgi:hypothetical protein